MTNIVITGGAGDCAKDFTKNYSSQFTILTPARSELDITNKAMVSDYFNNTPCDVLINNAGCIHPERILTSDTEQWINDINVNLIGTYLTTKAVLLNNPNAIIINISSTAAYNAYPNWSSYCASKAAVVTTSKCFANDGFAVYCLCPGAIDTKFRDNLNLSNANVMPCSELSKHVLDILENKYAPGDVLFFRKGEFTLNP